MNKPNFITLHGYKSDKPFTINANLIAYINKELSGYTAVYVSGLIHASDGQPFVFEVKETVDEIIALCR